MSDIQLYGLKNCDTCRKAMKALGDAGLDVTFVDIRSDAVSAEMIAGWVEAVGAKSILNTRSTTWRGLGDDDRARAESDLIGLLNEHRALIKRPVTEKGATTAVGFSAKTLDALT